MNETLPGQIIEGVRVWPSDDAPHLYRFVPGAPRLDRLPDGKPAIGMIPVGSGGILQATWRWELDEAEKAMLATMIAQSEPDLDLAQIELVPAEVDVREGVLELAAADGSWSKVAAGRPSGPPSFVMALSGRVDEAGRQAVEAALAGARGRMRLRIVGHVIVSHWAEARLAGDAADLLAELPADADASTAAAAIERGIADGTLVESSVTSPDAPEDLLTQAQQAARQRAVELLLAMCSDSAPTVPGGSSPDTEGLADRGDRMHRAARLDAAIRLDRPVQVALERSGDAAGTDRG